MFINSTLISGRVAEIGLRYKFDRLVQKAEKEGKFKYHYVDKFAKRVQEGFEDDFYRDRNLGRVNSLWTSPKGIKGRFEQIAKDKQRIKEGKKPFLQLVKLEAARYDKVHHMTGLTNMGMGMGVIFSDAPLRVSRDVFIDMIEMNSKIMSAAIYKNQTDIEHKSTLIAATMQLRSLNSVI